MENTRRSEQNAGAEPHAQEAPLAELPPRPDLPPPPEPVVRLKSSPVPGTSPQAEQYRQMGLAYSLPVALIAPVLVLTLLGAWLDSKLRSTGSWFTLAGAALGLIVGVRNMIGIASRLGR